MKYGYYIYGFFKYEGVPKEVAIVLVLPWDEAEKRVELDSRIEAEKRALGPCPIPSEYERMDKYIEDYRAWWEKYVQRVGPLVREYNNLPLGFGEFYLVEPNKYKVGQLLEEPPAGKKIEDILWCLQCMRAYSMRQRTTNE